VKQSQYNSSFSLFKMKTIFDSPSEATSPAFFPPNFCSRGEEQQPAPAAESHERSCPGWHGLFKIFTLGKEQHNYREGETMQMQHFELEFGK